MLLTIKDDFDLQKIADSGQCFRVKQIDADTVRFVHGSHLLYIQPGEKNTYRLSCTEEDWGQIWGPYFDLSRNYRKIRCQTNPDDSFMKKAVRHSKGLRILRQDPWEMLITFILSQRKSIPAIKKNVEDLSHRFGSLLTSEFEEIHAFPTPEQLKKGDAQALSECALGYRLPYIRSATDMVCAGALDLSALYDLSTPLLVESLRQVHGVGDKVASCIALFAYGRTECVPVDTWILKVIENEYHGINPFLSYGENAGIMQQYVFRFMTRDSGTRA